MIDVVNEGPELDDSIVDEGSIHRSGINTDVVVDVFVASEHVLDDEASEVGIELREHVTEEDIVRMFKQLRAELEEREELGGTVRLKIEAQFTAHKGEMSIKFAIGAKVGDPNKSWNMHDIEGPGWREVVSEYWRRFYADRMLTVRSLPRV